MKYFSEYLLENLTESQWWGKHSVYLCVAMRTHFCESLPLRQSTCVEGVEVPSLNSGVGSGEDTVPLVKTKEQFTNCPTLSQFWSLPKSSDDPCAITEILGVLGIYLNFLLTGLFCHLPITASRHSMPMEGQARFPEEKLSSFIQWKSGFL